MTPSFVGPTGKGVAAIALPTDASFSVSSYIGPPLVKIAGSGVSALAIADYDNATRTVTGIRVLCPGYGYDDATTCTIASPDGKSSFSCAVTMKNHENKGGFTLRGAATVKVSMLGTNTWGGATIVEAGCLDFDGRKSFPENTDLTVCRNASAVLKHGAHAVCDFSGTGVVTNDAGAVTIDGVLVISGEALARGEYPTFTGGVVFGENARIRIDGAEPTDEKSVRFVCLVADGGVSSVNGGVVPVEGWGEPWIARMSGTKVRVMKPQGLAIILK